MPDARHCEYALGIEVRGMQWYLSRAATPGNMMRTLSPFAARTWASVAELASWLDGQPASATNQVADLRLSAVPLRVVPESPAREFVVAHRPVPVAKGAARA